jgi:hypothetical protein
MPPSSKRQKHVRKTPCNREGEGPKNCCATATLASQPDFKAQKSWLEDTAEAFGHKAIFLPKFHPELNAIEMYWGAAKAHARSNCTYNFQDLRKQVPISLDSVKLPAIRRYFRKCFKYMDGYRNGLPKNLAGFGSTVFTRHRGIPSEKDLSVLD